MSFHTRLLKSLNGEPIGNGACGDVYRLIDSEPDTVIKVFKHLPEGRVETVKEECDALKSLRHTNVVQYFGFIEESINGKQIRGILMEYCAGGSLDKWVFDASKTYTMHTVVAWGEGLLNALVHLQENNRIHRDIKTSNTLLTEDFTIKIGDFGLAIESSETFFGEFAGTRRFMAPEALFVAEKGCEFSIKGDLYAVGLVLWEIIERRKVFSGKCDAVYSYKMALNKMINELNCPEKIKDVLKNILVFESDKRLPAKEALDHFKTWREDYRTSRCFEFPPSSRNNQKHLLRPIGFNGTKDEKPVDSEGSSNWIIPGRVETFTKSDGSIETPRAVTVDQNLEQKDMSLFDRFPLVEKLSQYDEFFKKTFDNPDPCEQSIEQTKKVQELIEEKVKEISNFKFDYEQQHSSVVENNRFVKNFDAKNRLSEPNGAAELVNQIWKKQLQWLEQKYYSVARNIKDFRESSHGAWLMPSWVNDSIELLEKMAVDFKTKTYFRCFFSDASKDEWLLVGVDQHGHLFLRKDLNYAQSLQGEWVDENCFNIKGPRQDVLGMNQMNFTGDECILVDMIIAALDRLNQRMILFAKMRIKRLCPLSNLETNFYSFDDGLDLPIEGYIFRLSNPPRVECNSQCGTIYEPSWAIKESQIPLCSCSSPEARQYLNIFALFSDILLNQHFEDMISLFHGKLLLTVEKKFTCQKYFLFYTLKSKEKVPIFPLDLPKDKTRKETICCMDANFNLVTRELSRNNINFKSFHRVDFLDFARVTLDKQAERSADLQIQLLERRRTAANDPKREKILNHPGLRDSYKRRFYEVIPHLAEVAGGKNIDEVVASL